MNMGEINTFHCLHLLLYGKETEKLTRQNFIALFGAQYLYSTLTNG